MSSARRLERRSVYRGRVIDLSVDRVELPGGRTTELELVHHRGAAAVLPMLDDGRVLLLRQFRYATEGWLLEIPAGTLEEGEDPESGARRELEEETGLRAGALHPLGAIWSSPGFLNERLWLFAASDLSPSRQNLDADEVLELAPLPFSAAVDQALSGEIDDAKTVCALLRAWGRQKR